MILTSADGAVFETPNATMRTLAAPSRGAHELSVWRVEMQPGQAGPEHTVDREQTWVVLEGRAEATVDGQAEVATSGDTLLLPAGAVRRIGTPEGLVALVSSPAAPTVTTSDQGTRALPWAA